MTASSEGVRRAPFLPEAASRFLRRRAIQLAGLALLAVAGVLALALISYAPGDPSFNTANSRGVANLAGLPGAYAADLLLQAVGAAAALLIAILAAWSWALISCRGMRLLWLRIALCPLSIVLAATGFASLAPPTAWPVEAGFGGGGGAVIAAPLGTALSGWGAGPLTLTIIAFSLSAIAFCTALGLPWREWRGLIGAAWAVVRMAAIYLFRSARWVHGKTTPKFAGADADTEKPQKAKREATEPRAPRFTLPKLRLPALPFRGRNRIRAEPQLYDDGEPEEGAAESRREPSLLGRKRAKSKNKKKITEETPRKTKPGKRAARESQQTLDLKEGHEFELPALDLLSSPSAKSRKPALAENAREQNAALLLSVLEDFGVYGEIDKVRPGPVVTLYEFIPRAGTRTARVIALADDIARSMSAISVRVATIRGRNVIGIELPNSDREMVFLRELLASENYENTAASLTLALGKDISGAPVIADLARMPHLLVAGTTGSGKSVAINSMILSLIYRLPPEQCKLILIDPKMLELSIYDDIPHLLTPVVTDPAKAVVALKWTVREMESRYQAMSKLGVRNISGYNKRLAEAARSGEHLSRRVHTHFDAETGEPIYEDLPLDLAPMPMIVVVVDEMADLMLVAGKDIEGAVQRLAQMARAAGIHIIMATQRPSVDVITGTIKANFPTRISFQVTSKIDSRTILGEAGAEQLLGQGDMLYLEGGGRLTRVHGPLVSDAEVEAVTDALRAQGRPDYIASITEEPESDLPSTGDAAADDPLYDRAVELVAREGKASTSFVQRHLQIGYNRAARIVERMESQGVISQANHAGKREVLIGEVGSFQM
ncbi:MAG: cell division protein FtsK [Rhodospirillaceae bacterium]|nr:cell division protein FtsK [Rhodospirillaceae bacterium]MBT5781006.1 cell division protein FtsK [Rhodospirillaceae bacterium]